VEGRGRHSPAKLFKGFRKLKSAQTVNLLINSYAKQVFFGDLDSCEYLTISMEPGTQIQGLHKLKKLKRLVIKKGTQSIVSAFKSLEEIGSLVIEKHDSEKRDLIFPALKKLERLEYKGKGLCSILQEGLVLGTLNLKNLGSSELSCFNEKAYYVNRLKYTNSKEYALPVLDSLYYNELEINYTIVH